MIIQCWSGPRNISTALMYSWRERSDFSVLDEPFYAFNMTLDTRGHPGTDEVIASQSTDPNDVIDALLRDGRAILRGINFAFDSAELDGTAYASASRIGTILEQLPELRLAVVGHTDNTGDFQYNMGLSERRAQAIVSALRKDFGIGPERLVGVGVGPVAPITSNATDEDKAQNRRVELVVIN